MAVPNRSILSTRYSQLRAGITKHITGPVVLAGATYAQSALLQPFLDWQQALAAVSPAKAQYHAAVVTEQALLKTCQTLWLLLEAYARLTYGGDTATLTDLGYAPAKHTPASPAAKVAAAAKAKATRIARGTLGKKAKAKITGSTPATPPATPAAPVPVK